MLVLSRQKNQKVQFPGLGISVEILEVKGAKVRVGIDAPLEVRVLRDELQQFDDQAASAKPHVIRLPQTLRHELRNTLHELSLMLHVYRKRAEKAGDASEATMQPQQMFEAIVERLESLGDHRVFAKSGMLVDRSSITHAEVGDALVVDDDDNERELLAGFLRMCGYRVATAIDGVEALAYLERNEPPRFIVLDMQMPRCDGQAFLRQVRKKGVWDPIHVFVISGSTPNELGLNRSDGYAHWIHKPLDPRLLVERLAEIESSPSSVA